jgi:prepilin-type N-terminal cleavage/methylation domain-containing protein
VSTRARGFTLIEVLGVVLVMSLLLGATVSFYINLTRQATRASEHTRTIRRAGALLDRIAGDLEHALLVSKPKDMDPLAHPWVFLAEPHLGQDGSDQIMFDRRELPRSTSGNASDLAVVAYTLQRSAESDHLELRRWETTELPDRLVREFPRRDDPASLLVADDLTHFSLRFLDATGEWVTSWDSSQLAESGQLPMAVEIQVGVVDPSQPEQELSATDEPVLYARQVELPMRPIDLEALLTPPDEKGKEEKEEDANAKKTVGQCIELSKLPMAGLPGLSSSQVAEIAAAVRNNPNAPFAPYAGLLGGMDVVKEECR